jgi:invasion protein IalB
MQMKKLTALVVASAFALGAGSALAAPSTKAPAKPAEAKKDDKAAAKDPNQFDSWRLQCQKPEGAADEICELFQPLARVIGKDPNDETKVRAQLYATIGVVRAPNADKPQMLMKAPLGSLLQAPVLKVPGHKDVTFPYLVCDQSGCTTIAIGLEKEFLDAVKAAEALETGPDTAQGAVVLAMTVSRPEQGSKPEAVTVKFALKGFTKGIEAVNKKAMPAAAKKDEPKKPAKSDKKK